MYKRARVRVFSSYNVIAPAWKMRLHAFAIFFKGKNKKKHKYFVLIIIIYDHIRPLLAAAAAAAAAGNFWAAALVESSALASEWCQLGCWPVGRVRSNI